MYLCTAVAKAPFACVTCERRHSAIGTQSVSNPPIILYSSLKYSSKSNWFKENELFILSDLPLANKLWLPLNNFRVYYFLFSLWRTWGSKQPVLLLGDHLLHLRREVQSQWTLYDDTGLPLSQSVGPQHGEQASGDVSGVETDSWFLGIFFVFVRTINVVLNPQCF